MKKLIFALLPVVLMMSFAQAQDGAKALKDARRAKDAFYQDQTNNKAKLTEAADNIAIATADAAVNTDAETWLLAGEIYAEIAQQIVTTRQLGVGSLDELPKVKAPALEAKTAFMQALKLADKKYRTKAALKGLQTAQSNLYNLGIYAYEDSEYSLAYDNFKGVIETHNTLKENSEVSSLDDPTAYNDQLYVAGLAAINAEKINEAKPIFEELSKANYDKPAIYEALYKIALDDDIDAAYAYLDEGRKKFPEDVSLLFAEINHFLKINKLDELIDKLKAAIEKEPDNVSLYSTLGNVYDNLYQREAEAGNEAKSQEYFDNSLSYYQQALAKEPDFTDAIYSIGALYFNRAATKTRVLNELADDLSREGQKKYEALKKDIDTEFDKALPYFKQVEQKSPADINTLIALKEIFARKNDFTTSTEFKNRLEKAQAGEELESYFKGKE